MKALRKYMTKEQFHLLDIPQDFAEEVELIILVIKPSKKYAQLSDDEESYAANMDQSIEEDQGEDQIWSKYL